MLARTKLLTRLKPPAYGVACTRLDDKQQFSAPEHERLAQEGPDTEFKYVVHIRIIETFINLMEGQGVTVPHPPDLHVSFAASKLLDMKSYRKSGLIWSYSIIRVRKTEEVIEES